MKYKLCYASDGMWNNEDKFIKYLKSLKCVGSNNNSLYINVDTIEELRKLIKSIPEELYLEEGYPYRPYSVVIDFRANSITIYDYYIE
jgi:hypothetical protein